MKKWRELLWFVIPFLALSALWVAYCIFNTAGVRYFLLMVADPFFIIALINTVVPSFVLSLILTLFYQIIVSRLLKKGTDSRKKKYITLFFISLVAPVLYIFIGVRAFDIVNNVVFTLQIGIVVTFLFWLWETVKGRKGADRPKETAE